MQQVRGCHTALPHAARGEMGRWRGPQFSLEQHQLSAVQCSFGRQLALVLPKVMCHWHSWHRARAPGSHLLEAQEQMTVSH